MAGRVNEGKYVYEVDGWGPDLLGVTLWYFLTRQCREFIEGHKGRR